MDKEPMRSVEYFMEEYRAAGQCACPPELDEIELIAAADGEASPMVYDHLAGCSACAERVQAIADLQGRLHRHLYRLFCPSSDELAAFLQNQMPPIDHARLDSHLIECPQCQAELAMLQAITAVPLIRPPVAQRRVIARPQQPNLPSPFEGSVYQAGPLRITLSIEQQRGSRLPRLCGAVRGNDQRGATASLICNGRIVSAVPLNDQGSFVLDELAPGNFSLSLRLPGYEVVVEALHF